MKHSDNYRFWQKAAGFYGMFMKKDKNMYGQLCSCIRPELNDRMYVLELACGTGQLSVPLAASVHQWEATDFSQKMIGCARKGPQLRNLYFSVQDATNLPYEAESFDVVLIANALHIMPHPEQALREIRRVLKSDGILIAPTFVDVERGAPGQAEVSEKAAAGGRAGVGHRDGSGHRGSLKMWFLERLGFQTFYEWNAGEYLAFLSEHGFCPRKHQLIQGRLLTECYVLADPAGRDFHGNWTGEKL